MTKMIHKGQMPQIKLYSSNKIHPSNFQKAWEALYQSLVEALVLKRKKMLLSQNSNLERKIYHLQDQATKKFLPQSVAHRTWKILNKKKRKKKRRSKILKLRIE
jgi:hypothetical protein